MLNPDSAGRMHNRNHRLQPVHVQATSATFPESDPRHGTLNGYCNLACRCDLCREANRVRHRQYMDQVRRLGRVLGTHGSSAAYDSGCRCPECRHANTEKSRNYRRDGNYDRPTDGHGLA